MKVLMIGSVSENLHEIKGGVEAVTVNLLSQFSQQDIEIYLVSFRKGIKKERVVNYSDKIKIHYLMFSLFKSKIFEFLFLGRRKIRKIIYNYIPDIIHIQGSMPYLLYLLGISKHNIVITKHGIFEEEYKYQIGFINKIKFYLKMNTEKFLLRNYSNFICISNYNKERLFQNNNELNLKVIPIPINEKFFNIPRSKSYSNRLLYVGVINKRKGLLNLLRAINKLNKIGKIFTLDVVGDYKEKKYKVDIESFIKENNLEKLVLFHGWLTQSKIKQLMSEISITVLPSYQETSPGIVAETMASGKVIVATNVGGVSEMFDNKESGFLFEKGNVNQLVDILDNLYDNKEVIREVGVKASILAKEKFYPKTIAEKTVSFYKDIVKERK